MFQPDAYSRPVLIGGGNLNPGTPVVFPVPNLGDLLMITDCDFVYDGLALGPLAYMQDVLTSTQFFISAPNPGTIHTEHWSGFQVFDGPNQLELVSPSGGFTFRLSGWLTPAASP